jgi:hypothetical protein
MVGSTNVDLINKKNIKKEQDKKNQALFLCHDYGTPLVFGTKLFISMILFSFYKKYHVLIVVSYKLTVYLQLNLVNYTILNKIISFLKPVL